MDKEAFAISCFKSPFLGDDGAVVGDFVYSKDLFFEGTHFKKSWLTPFQIGQKAMLVNISDAIVMNAKPKFALLGFVMPKNLSQNEIAQISLGIKKTCKDYGVEVIGGDTIKGDKIGISVTIISKLEKKAVFRNGVKNGDFLAFTGHLGQSLKNLKTLLNGYKISSNSRFVKPILKGDFFYKSAKFINAAMDISDGLNSDLPKILNASKKGIKFIKKLSQNELKSGEEYEILFSFSPKNRTKIEQIAKKTRTKITIFAKATKGHYKTNAKSHHF